MNPLSLSLFLIGICAVTIVFFLSHKPFDDRAEPLDSPEELRSTNEESILLKTDENGCEWFERNGRRYVSAQGISIKGSDTLFWDWHGRIGKGIGILYRPQEPFPCGELYCLKGNKEDIFLAYRPEEGWTVTDMQLFPEENTPLPVLRHDGFSYGEVYRITQEFPAEEVTKIAELTDAELLQALALAWLSGDPVCPPEDGLYSSYRIRLYSKDTEGLYISFLMNVKKPENLFFIEKRGLCQDTLLPSAFGEKIIKNKQD